MRFALPAVIAALLLAACAAPPPVASEDTADVPARPGSAFGRVRYLEDGKELAWGSTFLTTTRLTLFVRRVGGDEVHHMNIEGDGRFVWPLPPGDYVVLGFQFSRSSGATARRNGRLMGSFSVADATRATYVGELRIETDRRGMRYQVLDRYDEAIGTETATPRKVETSKGLMSLERPPGAFKTITGICGGWGITCDKDRGLNGVDPIKPDATASMFAPAESLTPLLEWKPSSRADVTYDVAIYESVALTFIAIGANRMRGPLVAYAEGLSEARYTPDRPLAPRTKYEWTVRVRAGDAVSTWSSTSHDLFLVVAWSRGSGQIFGFETPAK